MKKEKQITESQDMEILETQPEINGEENKAMEEVGISDKYLAHLDFVANNIDRFVTAKQKIWQAILKLAKPGDWVVFESEDKNSPTGKRSTVCLSGAGADRIASSIGISFANWKDRKELGKDEKGEWYRFWFEVDASFGGRTVRAMGRAGSRDKFFGIAHGQVKELSDIDESNIRMAAFHNAMKEGVKILLGVRNIPVEEFEKAGIQLAYARRYEFKEPTTNGLACSVCQRSITPAEANFSLKKYKTKLCRECQKGEEI
ncbi:MAG TPA: hypothetical protein ENN92_00755 [candidate division WWE3 bacterium]|uniref:Uncharacterized protein n=1 Tax=candidate division WWE3 bacterium TaxID=2053526 RepID=A0A7C1DGA2_UNCKA|nr:hypothetical protein [candidate division WWE3 bacterium]